jgi:hypothetical protein
MVPPGAANRDTIVHRLAPGITDPARVGSPEPALV